MFNELKKTVIGLVAASLPLIATAQPGYPASPIKLIAPTQPGGSIDAISRLLAESFQEAFKQTVVVENKGGAGGAIGTDYVAKARPDGYTLLTGLAATHSVQPALGVKLPYDPLTSFAPVALFAQGALVVAVNAASPVERVSDLNAWAKKLGRPLNFGTGGQATFGHLTGEAIRASTGLPLTHIPYRGSAPAATELAAGLLDLAVIDALSASQFVASGKVRLLAAAGPVRNPSFPNVPTLREQGLPFDLGTWVGLFAPAGTPPEVVDRLAAAVDRAIQTPAFADRVRALGLNPVFSGPQPFAAQLRKDYEGWRHIVQTTGIQVD